MSKPPKFLIVDSKTTRRHSIQNIFFSLEYETNDIEGISSAEDAAELARFQPYLAAFISTAEAYDWLKLINDLRQIADYNKLPIIVISENPTKETVVSAYAAGANGFLRYPCSLEDVEKVIKIVETPPESEELVDKRKITT